MSAVGFLGLGAMGRRMAARVADAGHDVRVWNRTPGPADALAEQGGVTVAGTIGATVAGADVVVAMVTDDDASRTVWEGEHGALATMPSTAIAVEASTVTHRRAVELGEAAAAAGVAMIEAPVVGSRPQADAAALFVLAGGDEAALDRARPVLDTYAAAVRHVGPVGSAAAMKLAVNSLFGIQVAAYGEVVGMLERSGVASDDAIEILGNLPITSPGLNRVLGLFAARDFSPNFPVHLVAKDFGYALELARGLGADTPLIESATAVFRQGASDERADLDISGIAAHYLWSDEPE